MKYSSIALLVATVLCGMTVVVLAADTCAMHTEPKGCKKDPSGDCAWCGHTNWTNPEGRCYSRSASNHTCCYGDGPEEGSCQPKALMCSPNDTCVKVTEYVGMDSRRCQVGKCCPKDKPKYCSGSAMCIAEADTCCGAMVCGSGKFCCGYPSPAVGGSCCGVDTEQCCSAPDGLNYYCCKKSEVCSSGGCGKKKFAFPL